MDRDSVGISGSGQTPVGAESIGKKAERGLLASGDMAENGLAGAAK
jgi:hypothetical protein